MDLNVQHRRLIATSTLCVLAGLLASFRQPPPAKAEHGLPPVIRLVRVIGDDEPCYWTAVANLHHIDKQRLSDAQFKKVEELNEQVSELSELASQYLIAAGRNYDRTEQRRLEDLADRAQDEADRLYDQLLAIKP